jgi:hypothetical protein
LIEGNAADWAPDIFKAAVSAIPLVGGAAAFLIEQRPHTQLKRVVAYLRLLHEEVMRLKVDGSQLEVRLDYPEAAKPRRRRLTGNLPANQASHAQWHHRRRDD